MHILNLHKIMPMKETKGERIKEIVDELGLTLEAFGKPIGVSKSSVSFWIDGRTKDLKMDHLFGIEDHFGICARWIAIGEGPKYAGRVAEAPPPYSPTTKAICDIIETLDEEAKRAIHDDVQKEKQIRELKSQLKELQEQQRKAG